MSLRPGEKLKPLNPEYAKEYCSPIQEEIDLDLSDLIDISNESKQMLEKCYRRGYQRCIQNEHGDGKSGT